MTRTRIGIHDSCSRVIDPALDAMFKSVATSASEMGFVECIVMQMTMRARRAAHDSGGAASAASWRLQTSFDTRG